MKQRKRRKRGPVEIKTEYFNEIFEPRGRVRERYRPLFEALGHIGEEVDLAMAAPSRLPKERDPTGAPGAGSGGGSGGRRGQKG